MGHVRHAEVLDEPLPVARLDAVDRIEPEAEERGDRTLAGGAAQRGHAPLVAAGQEPERDGASGSTYADAFERQDLGVITSKTWAWRSWRHRADHRA